MLRLRTENEAVAVKEFECVHKRSLGHLAQFRINIYLLQSVHIDNIRESTPFSANQPSFAYRLPFLVTAPLYLPIHPPQIQKTSQPWTSTPKPRDSPLSILPGTPKTSIMLSALQNPRQAAAQVLNFALILSTAFMMWKGLSVIADSPSPIVVVLSGSMEPAFQRGDLLFLWNRNLMEETKVGEIVVYNVKGKDIPIVHRLVRKFGTG
jgi:hypothetical protein